MWVKGLSFPLLSSSTKRDRFAQCGKVPVKHIISRDAQFSILFQIDFISFTCKKQLDTQNKIKEETIFSWFQFKENDFLL